MISKSSERFLLDWYNHSNPTGNNDSTKMARSPEFSILDSELQGDCSDSEVIRGLYSTDASVYQVLPRAVARPASVSDIERLLAFAGEHELAVLPRGAGTSQNGQTVNDALVIDNSRYFNQLLDLDLDNQRCTVEPGMVLDTLNRQLKQHGLWFPVDVSTASRATIGGMAGNNSCGQRSIVYGTMRHNVVSMDAYINPSIDNSKIPQAQQCYFGKHRRAGNCTDADQQDWKADQPSRETLLPHPDSGFVASAVSIAEQYKTDIDERFPKLLRRVGGYNLDALLANDEQRINLSHVLVGSEGTLGVSTAIELQLAELPGQRVVGVCHFPTFYQAMDAAQHLVELKPTAVELMDATLIELANDIAAFRPVMREFVRGEPAALLLVEFATGQKSENRQCLNRLTQCMGDLGFSWDGYGKSWGGVVEIESPRLQAAVGEVRKSGLNIMMSMKSEGKPVSFVEDCAVALPDLAEYTAGLTEVFKKHGTRGTWYAHASVGCLHVRPVLNLKLEKDRHAMREIAEEAFALVRQYKGSHSGEHGDGISRSEFHRDMFGERLVGAFESLKSLCDPANRFNPGRIVNPPRMNDKQLLRYHADYQTAKTPMRLDWSAWPGAKHGMQAAVEMCNNNGACRKLAGGAMCPSYRVTRDEQHLTRGRANALRLALSGQLELSSGGRQLGPASEDQALASDELHQAMKYCVSCKACRRECPTGVDMARMKIEVLAAQHKSGKHGLHEYLIAELPRYAHRLTRAAAVCGRIPGLNLFSLFNRLQSVAKLTGPVFERITGFSSKRQLPLLARKPFAAFAVEQGGAQPRSESDKPVVYMFADTFNRYFEPHVLESALRVLRAVGYQVTVPEIPDQQPLCCGRTYLSCGRTDDAKQELKRTRDHFSSLLGSDETAVIIGLEPSCLFTFRDEIEALLPGADTARLQGRVLMFEEFLAQELKAGNLHDFFIATRTPELRESDSSQSSETSDPNSLHVLLHGHCHQKAFGQTDSIEAVLSAIPGIDLKMIESSCCGMAGSFGYGRETADVSIEMAELDLAPAIRRAFDLQQKRDRNAGTSAETVVVADGTSCRAQIRSTTGQTPLHVAELLDRLVVGAFSGSKAEDVAYSE